MSTRWKNQAETARQSSATESFLSKENCVRKKNQNCAKNNESLCGSSDEYVTRDEEIIKNLMSDPEYCRQFFFDTEVPDAKGNYKKKACQIAPLRSKMIYDLKKDYDVDVKPEDFSEIIYLALWANGSWSPLSTFQGRCSFFAWLRKVAKNAILERLVEEHWIDEVRSRTVGNTRLALLSQAPSKCKLVIDSMLAGSKYHTVMTFIYADRLPKETIMKRLHISDAEYEASKKAGENKLKDALLRSEEFSEENILRDKTKHVVTVSADFAADLSEWMNTKSDVNPLSDVFGTDLTDEEVREKVVEFLYEFPAKLNWSDQDRYIWSRRFIEGVAPVDVAEEVGRNRGWLDTRYSRLNNKFEKAVRKWWKSCSV